MNIKERKNENMTGTQDFEVSDGLSPKCCPLAKDLWQFQ